jgi:acyl-ACP thioesterase
LPVIGNFILHAATVHAQERGFGFDAMVQSNAAWVVSRLSIEMKEYPEHEQDLTVETWVESVDRFFTQRCFSFMNQKEEIIGYARSIWAAIDMQTRRPLEIPTWRPDLLDFVDSEKECPIDKIAKIPSIECIEPIMGYAVRYSDIDINKHMNSIKYIEHVINVFELAVFKQKIIRKFEIVYLQEGRFGDKLKLYKQDVLVNESIIDTKRCEESICRTRILWQEK